MKLIVGLGNVGRRYQGTRHNIGFEVVAELARRFATGKPRLAFEGETRDAAIGDVRCLLLTPHTYMNLSGRSVQQARSFVKLANEDLLIVSDDINLPLGRLRLRSKGSSGGQKGLEDIIRYIGEDFPRLRIGVGNPPPGRDAADYVLGKFSKDEQPEVEAIIRRAADAVAFWVAEGTAAAMNRYNAPSRESNDN
jgi:PTH1 family peptidyl-tRNA hydrolase